MLLAVIIGIVILVNSISHWLS